MIYLYGFDIFAGIDKVVMLDEKALQFSANIGDLLKSGDNYYLVLGDEIQFPEQYKVFFNKSYDNNKLNLNLIESGLISSKTIQLLHWMVGEYYSTYKNVMKYFLPDDVSGLLQKEIISKKNNKEQELIVYPDLWSIYMSIKQSDLDQKGLVILNSHDSQSKKNKIFWQIKTGFFDKILTTHAEIFQDFTNLKKITIIDPHKRYYSNQQDPRYKTPDVVAKMAEIWSADLKIIGD